MPAIDGCSVTGGLLSDVAQSRFLVFAV